MRPSYSMSAADVPPMRTPLPRSRSTQTHLENHVWRKTQKEAGEQIQVLIFSDVRGNKKVGGHMFEGEHQWCQYKLELGSSLHVIEWRPVSASSTLPGTSQQAPSAPLSHRLIFTQAGGVGEHARAHGGEQRCPNGEKKSRERRWGVQLQLLARPSGRQSSVCGKAASAPLFRCCFAASTSSSSESSTGLKWWRS